VRVFSVDQANAMLGDKRCDHCGAVSNTRRRSLNGTMARQLAALYRYFNNPALFGNLQFHRDDSTGHWVHASRYLTHLRMERECLKLRFWDFIEEHPYQKEDGNPHNGYIRLTTHGKSFCKRKFKTYRYILTKNHGEGFVGFVAGEMVDIVEAGQNGFDYSKEIR
jgi:hypothetical protein